MSARHVNQLLELRQRQSDLQAAWLRQLLTLAAGGLALLVGLRPPAAGIGQYFLAGTWILLGVGICSGAAATFLEVHAAKTLATRFQSALIQALQEGRDLSSGDLVVATPHRFFAWSRYLMVASLLLAVCCLVVYAVLATFAVASQ